MGRGGQAARGEASGLVLTRTLLVDADLLAYVASAGTQRSYAFDGPDEPPAVSADFDEAIQVAEEKLQRLIDRLQPDEVTVCLSDDMTSWRQERVDPGYKAHRTAERPQQLYAVKDWLRETYDVAEIPTLEADDVMGIIATDPSRTDERIIVSADKDMMTIPGLLYRPHLDDGRSKKPKIQRISLQDAERFHLWQTLVGDATDGYPGCPGVGPKGADAILNEGLHYLLAEREITRGERKGEREEVWLKKRDLAVPAWRRLLSAYHKAGLTEADALRQARLARILHFEDFDGERPILWNPRIS